MIKEWLDNLTGTDIIASYAAIVSTIALIWSIFNSIIEKVSRVEVKIGVHMRISVPDFGRMNSIIKVAAVNKSIYDLYINVPIIKLPVKVDNKNRYTMTNLDNPVNYPILIKPREQHEMDIELGMNLINLLKNCKSPGKKIRFEITDTTGKKFKSNKIKISNILGA